MSNEQIYYWQVASQERKKKFLEGLKVKPEEKVKEKPVKIIPMEEFQSER